MRMDGPFFFWRGYSTLHLQCEFIWTKHTVLLINLTNRVQPLIRYDLGDRATVSPEACPCGSHLSVIQCRGAPG